MKGNGGMDRRSVIIIPSLNPDEKLIEYVENLVKSGFKRIIIINDGSKYKVKYIYEKLEKLPECLILTHAINMGKGRALKDAFNYYLTEETEGYYGIITVDSDGQHVVEDVIRMDQKLIEHKESLILGARDFNEKNVPLKSSFGNKFTRYVIKLFYGGNITDTQTGLRAIPNNYIKDFLTLYGERFEYETTMLIYALQKHIPIIELPIRTVYINENNETHFRPVADSFAIYCLILFSFFKYTLASVSSFFIDYSIFGICILGLKDVEAEIRIWTATLIARAISSFYNYNVNRKFVFQDEAALKQTILKYYSLCIIQAGCSASLIWMLYRTLLLPEIMLKIFIDTILFLCSFRIQQRWVFKGKERKC